MFWFQIFCFILGIVILDRAITHLYTIFGLIGDNICKVDEIYARRCLLLERIILGREITETVIGNLSDGFDDDSVARNCEILLDGFFPGHNWVVVTPAQVNILAQRSDRSFRIFRDGFFVKSFYLGDYVHSSPRTAANLRDLVCMVSEIE